MNTKEFPLVCVEITRNREGIRVTVPEHEARVLVAMHGAINAQVLSKVDPDDDTEELDTSAEVELSRLTRRYLRTGHADPVQQAFPNGALDLERYGFESGAAPEALPESGGVNHKLVAKRAKKAAKKAAEPK